MANMCDLPACGHPIRLWHSCVYTSDDRVFHKKCHVKALELAFERLGGALGQLSKKLGGK